MTGFISEAGVRLPPFEARALRSTLNRHPGLDPGSIGCMAKARSLATDLWTPDQVRGDGLWGELAKTQKPKRVSPARLLPRQRMVIADQGFESFVEDMSVDLGRRNVGVAEHCLHAAQIRAVGEEVRGEGVAQDVR